MTKLKILNRAAGYLVLGLFGTTNLLAQAEKVEAPRASFRLSAPEISKTHREAFGLLSADLNGDQLPDFGVVENENSLIKLFLSDSDKDAEKPYSEKEFLLNKFAFSAVPFDWNGDNRTDLLVSQAGDEVVVFLQTEEGTLASAEETFLEGRYLFTGQLVGSKEPELGVVKDRTMKLYKGTKSGIEEKEFAHLSTAHSMLTSPEIVDFNGDGLLDLLYEPDDQEDYLAIISQSKNETFPVETPIEVGSYYNWAVINKDKNPQICTIVSPTRRLKVLALEDKILEDDSAIKLPDSQSIMVFQPGKEAKPETAVVGDITGDKLPEIVVAISGQPYLLVLRIGEGGALEETLAPTFKDCQQLGLLWNPKTNRNDVLVLSTEEKVLGISQWDEENNILPFSASLKFPHQPVAFSVFGEGDSSTLYVALNNTEKKQFFLETYEERKLESLLEGKWVYTDETMGLLTLPNKDKIQGFQVRELNGAAPPEVILFQEFKDPVVYAVKKSEKPAEGAEGEVPSSYQPVVGDSLLVGMLKDAKPRNMETLENGRTLLLRKEFARVIQLRESGVEILEQLTGERPAPEYASHLIGEFQKKGTPGILLLNAKSNRLELFQKNSETELMELAGESEVVLDNARETVPLALDLNQDGVQEILLLDKSKIKILMQGTTNVSVVSTRQAETEEGGYGILFSLPEFEGGLLAALEMKEYSLEFLQLNESRELVPDYKFVMYNLEGRFQRRNPLEENPQPREMLSRDFNDDGLVDVLCLAHDKILLYYQEKAAAKTEE